MSTVLSSSGLVLSFAPKWANFNRTFSNVYIRAKIPNGVAIIRYFDCFDIGVMILIRGVDCSNIYVTKTKWDGYDSIVSISIYMMILIR